MGEDRITLKILPSSSYMITNLDEDEPLRIEFKDKDGNVTAKIDLLPGQSARTKDFK